MLLEAGYSLHEQYQILIFHYHVVVPRLGPAPPPDGQPKWQSPLSMDGSPAEYSWKWNTKDQAPEVRYTIECLGDFTGSAADPFNTESTKELMYQLSLKMPEVDLTWFHQLVAYVYDMEKSNYIMSGGTPTTAMVLAFELLKKGLMIKAYFVAPKKIKGAARTYDVDFWASAMKTIAPQSDCADRVFHFLKTNHQGQQLHPAGLAIDCVVPSKSRVKFYLQTANTDFDSVREIMTMGGMIQGLDRQLDDLHSLIKLITGLDANYPSSKPVSATTAAYENGLKHFENVPELLAGYIYYFDIAPGKSMPDIKFYIPTRHYAKDDLQVARGLTTWMKERGRGQYVENYMRVLDSICTHRKLEEGNGVHAFVSCAFQKGDVSVTSYVGPEAYHPARLLR